MTPRSKDKPVPSLAALHFGIEILVAALVFYYADFSPQWTDCWVARYKSLLRSLARDGKLTTGIWRAKQWIGIVFVRKMGKAWLLHALTYGRFDWDSTITRLLSVALQSAVNRRVGEIVRSHGYANNEYSVQPQELT